MTRNSEADRKCYGQMCTVSTALDVAGDRWTLLLMRELLGGPARFQELLDGLPGVARNLLSSRLRRLEADGLVRRVQAQGGSLYALTELGAGIRPVVEELGFWGVRLPRVAPAEHDRSIRSIAMAIQAILSRAGDALPDARCVVELDVDGEPIEIVLGSDPTAVARLSTEADARIRASREAMARVLVGRPFEDDELQTMSGPDEARITFLRSMRAPFAAFAGV